MLESTGTSEPRAKLSLFCTGITYLDSIHHGFYRIIGKIEQLVPAVDEARSSSSFQRVIYNHSYLVKNFTPHLR